MMRIVAGLFVASLLFLPAAGAAQTSSPSGTPGRSIEVSPGLAIPKDMTPYYVVLLVQGKIAAPSNGDAKTLLAEHLTFIRTMIEKKVFLLAGPLTDGGRIQGIVIVAARSADEATRLVSDDPEVKAGHLAVETHAAMLPSLASLKISY